MKLKTILIAAVLVDFLALTAWAIANASWAALAEMLSSPLGIQVAVDLCIALTFASVWIWRDAKSRGLNPVPWIVLTWMTGSPGPLAYAIRRELAAADETQPNAVPVAS